MIKLFLMRWIFPTVLAVLFMAVYFLVSFAENSKDFDLQPVADGVYLHQGVHVDFSHPQNDDIANIGFIVGDECIAVIDTGGSIAIGEQLLEAVRHISALPICYVINTHVHFDHVLGNAAFIKESPRFVGHENLAEAMELSRDFFLEQFTEALGDAPGKHSIIGPDVVVSDELRLDLGDRVIILTAQKTAHSQSDLTVFDVSSGTLWAGDLIFRERIPALEGSLRGWLTVLDELRSMDAAVIIPGHGAVAGDWEKALISQEAYLNTLLLETRKAISEGMFLQEAVESIGAEEKQRWLLHEQHHSRNVSKAFTELEWE